MLIVPSSRFICAVPSSPTSSSKVLTTAFAPSMFSVADDPESTASSKLVA